MQGSELSPEPIFALPRWMRIGMAAFLLAVAVLVMWKGFLRLHWAPPFCLGFYYLIAVPRQKGEAFAAYIKKPRAMASSALILAALTVSGYSLYTLYSR
jgi:hypothetical protein